MNDRPRRRSTPTGGARRAEGPPLVLTRRGKVVLVVATVLVVAVVVLIPVLVLRSRSTVDSGSPSGIGSQLPTQPGPSEAQEPAQEQTQKQATKPARKKKTPADAATGGPVIGSLGIDLTRFSHTEADSLWVVVNKKHPLEPLRYAPNLATVAGASVDERSAPHLSDLLAQARADGAPLRIVSAYRSYDRQVSVYGAKRSARGQAEADRWSARPGFSEHQTGLAVDLGNATSSSCQLQTCFADTAGGRWLAQHAPAFGYIIRYTTANQNTTGYNPEPWHIRYVGVDLAQAMTRAGVSSLEDVFDVTGGDYE